MIPDAACVAVALARAGHAHVTARCLAQLVRWAQDRGVTWVLAQVDDDPGLTFILTDEWFVARMRIRAERRWPRFGEDWR